MPSYFLRIGAFAEVHATRSSLELQRGNRLIVRTDRGVELAEVVGFCAEPARQSAISVLRTTTEEDELLIRRLQRHKREAVEACRESLRESGSAATLLDVDQLFDGGTLVMHFLGAIDDAAAAATKKIVESYESIARTRHFAKLLKDGCGPDCGTKEGGGCGSSCSGCAVASACK